MAAYWAALRAIYPDRPVRCALLWTAGPRLDEIAEPLLAAAAP
jgi:ATP-dependent helicase/nuclease subunit A